ncbi:DNA-binding response regulator [Pusillimonas sp. TS35]|uniref:response regulator transcription factor n=1 Tax=Paracandidimonas lactea TaxID=2895524 RepID=UPI00136F9A0D|nr:response regulator transcription factor [Paracandidimonas lactea]MYN12049.1 DNA-binding response regulator [Pusillimonas sp. TS35]
MSTILVIEPHPLLRLGLLQLLTDITPNCMLRGADYSDLSREPTAESECDLILLSVADFGDVHRLVNAARTAYSPKAVLLMSDTPDLPYSPQSLPPIVTGYVPKHASPEVLQASVRLVLAGGTCFPMPGNTNGTHVQLPQQASLPSITPANGPWPVPEPDKPRRFNGNAHPECEMLGLTPRQYEVLVLLARGYPMKTVGRYLNISVATAKAHTETLYQRLDVHNRNAAVYAAVSRGATLGLPSITTQKAPEARA